jgi:hypothetical protein
MTCMGSGMPLCPLGVQKAEACFSAQGVAGSGCLIEGSRLNLNLRTWNKIFVSLNLAVGRVIGKLLGRLAGFDLGLKC